MVNLGVRGRDGFHPLGVCGVVGVRGLLANIGDVRLGLSWGSISLIVWLVGVSVLKWVRGWGQGGVRRTECENVWVWKKSDTSLVLALFILLLVE